MKVRKEMPNKKNEAQHTFILENETSEIWYNAFLTQLPDFSEAVGAEVDYDGNVDTANFVGKYVDIFIEAKPSSKEPGKSYLNVTDYRPTSPESLATLAQAPADVDADIPF